jgi:hypothetical protein
MSPAPSGLQEVDEHRVWTPCSRSPVQDRDLVAQAAARPNRVSRRCNRTELQPSFRGTISALIIAISDGPKPLTRGLLRPDGAFVALKLTARFGLLRADAADDDLGQPVRFSRHRVTRHPAQ